MVTRDNSLASKGTVISRRPFNSSAKVIPLFPEGPAPTEEDSEDDAWLLERIAERDHAAFAALVRRHTARFFRVAYRFLHNHAQAEDTVQDAFLKLWERPGLWQAGKNTAFTTWFHRIVVNQCLDFAKKKRPLPLIDDSWIEDERQTQESSLLEKEKQQLLEEGIAKLPLRQRTALNLCFYEGLSNGQAAEVMGVRLKALQALIMRAKTTLKNELNFV